jgi:serine/threonine-protein kinase HipA
MRKARILVNKVIAGMLEEANDRKYFFTYEPHYQGPPVSLTMPLKNSVYEFNQFPPFFEGLLPEGILLEALLRKYKLDKNDYFGQLLKIGQDVVGAVTIEELK